MRQHLIFNQGAICFAKGYSRVFDYIYDRCNGIWIIRDALARVHPLEHDHSGWPVFYAALQHQCKARGLEYLEKVHRGSDHCDSCGICDRLHC